MTWREIKKLVNRMTEFQLDYPALVVESDDGQLGASFAVTDIGIHDGEVDELKDKQPFLTISAVRHLTKRTR